MAFTNETKNYGLPDWIGPDKPTWLVDMNNAFETIDNQMKANETAAMQAKQIGESAMDTAGNAVEATHTNAAAISALTASLAETDTRVDGLTPPTNAVISTSGAITGFGTEKINAVYINGLSVIYLVPVSGSTATKGSMIDPPQGVGLPSSAYKAFPGKINLFNNSLDPPVGTEMYRFFLSEINTGNLCAVVAYRGTDGYYYTMPETDYTNMGNGRYAAAQYAALVLNGTRWPTN